MAYKTFIYLQISNIIAINTTIYIYLFVCEGNLIYLQCSNIIAYLFRKYFICLFFCFFMESINLLLYKKLLKIASENMDMASAYELP